MGVWVLFNELVILMTCNILQCNDLLNWGFKYVFKCIFIVFIVFIFYVNMCLKMYLNMYQIFKTIIHLNILLVGNLNVCYECQALTFPILITVIILYLSITIFFHYILKTVFHPPHFDRGWSSGSCRVALFCLCVSLFCGITCFLKRQNVLSTWQQYHWVQNSC